MLYNLRVVGQKKLGVNNIFRYTIIMLLWIVFQCFQVSCRKAEGDPVISFRSRDARLAGTWIYSDTINGNSVSYKVNLTIDGKVNAISATTLGVWGRDTLVHLANWYWAHESKCKNKKTKIIFEYNDYFVREYNLISLRHNEVKIWYLKNIANPGKVSYMTMVRQ